MTDPSYSPAQPEWFVQLCGKREEVYIISRNFKHDEMLKLTGDYKDKAEKIKYAQALCDKLNQ